MIIQMHLTLALLILILASVTSAAEFKIIAAEVPPLLEKRGEGIDGLSGKFGKIVAEKIRKSGKAKDFEVTWVPWKRALFEVKKGNNTLFFPLAWNTEREKEYAWLGHMGKVESWFYALDPKIKIDSNDDLKKYRIGFLSGSMREIELKKILGEKATNLDGLTEDIGNYKKLIFGRIEVWAVQVEVFEKAQADYNQKNSGSPKVHTIKKFLDQEVWIVSSSEMPKEQQNKIRALFKD